MKPKTCLSPAILPGTMFVGVGQCAARHRAANPQVVKLRGARTQANFDVAQALPVRQLGEGQAEELVRAGEPVRFVIALMSLHDPAKSLRMNPVHELGKNHFRRLHPAKIEEPCSCRSHPFSFLFLFKPITYNESFARRLDTTDITDKYAPGSSQSKEVNSFVDSWNQQIGQYGGSMTTKTPTKQDQIDKKAYQGYIRSMDPTGAYDGKVVGHIPDVVAGGKAAGGPTMAMDPSVNSSIGRQVQIVNDNSQKQTGKGYTYNQVVVISPQMGPPAPPPKPAAPPAKNP